ncbi:MAG: hypothetical protein NE330_20060, partial [Lentisphaeraceae bacterium]|nr:hypothetical protein [Lentisphaeraceae bacterium]
MKVSHYNIILVLSVMFAGIASSSIIFIQANQLNKSQENLQSLSSKKALVKDTKLMVSKFLITLDLYLANQQTYLFKSLSNEANSIKETLKNLPPEYSEEINSLNIRI